MENKYSFQVAWSDEDNTYFASCPEFPGLLAHGDTPEEAIKEAGIALEGVIEVYKESDLQLPEPLTRQEYSGQFRLRLPRSLHRQAAQMAEREGVSLNTFVTITIAEKVGAEVAKKDAEKVAINIQTVQLASTLTINALSPGGAATTDKSVDQWSDYQLPTNTCRDQ
jgi:predicted RNase H-like HicB family nuclease